MDTEIRKAGVSMGLRQQSLALLERIKSDRSNYVIVHYSCESFDNSTKATPRPLSIIVGQLKKSDDKSFGLHIEAEERGISENDIKATFDKLELAMLDRFFEYMERHKDKTIIHWRMRNSMYGFEALKNRYRALGGQKDVSFIDLIEKIDIPEHFKVIYGENYIDDPKMTSLFKKNNLSMKDIPDIKTAISLFETNKFSALHRALLHRFDNLKAIIDKALDKRLKTDWKFKEVYSVTPGGIFDYSKEHWLGALLLFVIGIFMSAFISKFALYIFSLIFHI